MRKLALVTALSLTVTLAAVGVVIASAPGPDYLDVMSSTKGAKGSPTARLTATTKAPIPSHPDSFIRSNPVVGIAWVDLQTSKAFVATIHPAIGRDSNQNPRAWHAHTVTLAGGATAPNDFCLGAIDSTPTAGISIHGATMKVNVRRSALPVPATAFDTAVGFTLQHDTACGSAFGVRTST